MKAACFLAVMLLSQSALWPCFAQIKGARDYTRKVVPQPPPPGRAPAQPALPPAQAAVPAQPVDPEKAKAQKDAALKRTVEFQIKRAEAGSATAQYDLAVRYMTGDGVSTNLAKARQWLETAKTNGHQFAQMKLNELSKLEKSTATTEKPKQETK